MCPVHAGRQWWWHVVREIQAAQGKIDEFLKFVGKRALEGETLEMDKKHGRQTGNGKLFCCLAEGFA